MSLDTTITPELIPSLAWAKMGGLLPAIVQDHHSRAVLMLGYMNEASLAQTLASGLVTFYSRSRQALWQKGETSGNHLKVVTVSFDCDQDALLIQAVAHGPTCHTGSTSCFGASAEGSVAFLTELWRTIEARAAEPPTSPSYTRQLLSAGVLKQAQKVGEEGVEVALAGAAQDDQALLGESADLLFHLMVLLKGRGLSFAGVVSVLEQRHRPITAKTQPT